MRLALQAVLGQGTCGLLLSPFYKKGARIGVVEPLTALRFARSVCPWNVRQQKTGAESEASFPPGLRALSFF